MSSLYSFFEAVREKLLAHDIDLFMQPTDKNAWLFVGVKGTLFAADHIDVRDEYPLDDEIIDVVVNCMVRAMQRAEKAGRG